MKSEDNGDDGASLRLKLSGKKNSPVKEIRGLSKAFRKIRTLTAQSKTNSGGTKKSSRPSKGAPVRKSSQIIQRVSVRVNYASNKGDGQWAAHGKYIERESANLENNLEAAPPSLEVEEKNIEEKDLNERKENVRTDRVGGIYRRISELGESARGHLLRGWGNSALYKPYIGEHHERKSPPKTINSLRSLSSIGMAGQSRGAEMLLQSDARNIVVAARTAGHSLVRRGSVEQSRKNGEKEKIKSKPALGFGSDGDSVKISETLERWQKSNDEHVFKIIISPEFGERMDLQKHTKSLVAQIERDIGTKLQWVAVEHFNTEHPHVHLAIRGIDEQANTLRLGKEYIQKGIRNHAQRLATNQLGYRTEKDMQIAAERQVAQHRFTQIDRLLRQKSEAVARGHRLDYSGEIPKAPFLREQRNQEMRRLQHLCQMGLAHKTAPMTWIVDRGFEQALRQMQIGNDRLKSLHMQRETLSDPRLPLVSTELRNVRRLSGRVIGTGVDEERDKAYLLLEGIDAKVHYLYQDEALSKARKIGQLQPGSFIEIERTFQPSGDGRKRVATIVNDLGPAQALLTNQKQLAIDALRMTRGKDKLPEPSGFGGWLGRYHAAVSARAKELQQKGQLRMGKNGFEYVQLQRSNSRGNSR